MNPAEVIPPLIEPTLPTPQHTRCAVCHRDHPNMDELYHHLSRSHDCVRYPCTAEQLTLAEV